MDVTSFTPDLVELLCQIGNRVANSVWEAKADPALRPGPQSSRESRLKFISAKYVQRAFVAPLSPTLSITYSPDELLLDTVKKGDLAAALYALALHGSANTVDPATGMHVVILALATQTPLSPTLPSTSSTASSDPTAATTPFPLAELLLQNGGELPYPLAASTEQRLSDAARSYVAHKTAKRCHQDAVPPVPQEKLDRLQKRVSSGPRLHRDRAVVER